MNTEAIKAALWKASTEMKFILYPEPEQLLELLGNCELQPPPTNFVTDRSLFRFPAPTPGGKTVSAGWDEMLAAVRRRGFHGFVCGCKGKTGYGHDGEVHAWIDRKCEPETALMFLAHEVGHYHGEPCSDEWAEEERADLFGLVAVIAFRFLQQRVIAEACRAS